MSQARPIWRGSEPLSVMILNSTERSQQVSLKLRNRVKGYKLRSGRLDAFGVVMVRIERLYDIRPTRVAPS